MTDLALQHPERLALALGLLAVALVLLTFGYRRTSWRGPTRWVAFACKATVWALLALCLTDPVATRRQPKTGENEVLIVADNSASLSIAEQPGQPTRAAQLRSALNADETTPPAWIEELGKSFRVKTVLADDRLQSVADFRGLDSTGPRSELHRALTTLSSGGPGSRVAAIVLLSDGSPTDSPATAPPPAGPRIPIFTVQVGRAAPQPDLHLLQHSLTQTSFEDTPITLTAQVAGHGFSGQDIAVAVVDEAGKTVASEKLRLTKDDTAHTVRLRVPAVKPGVSFYRLLVLQADLLPKLPQGEWKTLAKEATLANNERLLSVDRGAGPYRILYVSGRPNWEYKFMRRALMGDDEIQMPSLIRIAKREPKFEWRGRTGETSNPLFRGFGQQAEAQRYDQPVLIRLGTRDAKELSDGFPKTPEDLFGEYRAIVIDDLEAAFFTQEQMNLIERFVSERGGALLMLGGQECYQVGGYDHTPIGRMLPVYLDRISQAPALQNARLNLTREGWLEPWTRLRPNREEDEKRLAQMPAFQAVNQTFSIKPGASVLATVSSDEQEALPALAAQRFGEGRVSALMVGDLWRWGLRDEAAAQDHQRAWRQMMRSLVVDVPDRLQITATPQAERVKLQIRVRDRAFIPLDDALVKIAITTPDAQTSTLYAEPSLKEPGLFEADFYPRQPGPYRAVAEVRAPPTAEAQNEGTPSAPTLLLGSSATGWAHDPLTAEFAHLKPGTEWLTNLAKESGGQALLLTDVAQLPELLKNIRVPVEETLSTPLWHTPWFFLLILALLTLEWYLRRRHGLA